MKRFLPRSLALAAAVLAIPAAIAVSQFGPVAAGESAVMIPPPAVDTAAAGGGTETAIFAGGCFWGVQAIFQHTDGVLSAVSGYSGGTRAEPSYEQVSSGVTGHAESVEVRFDPKKITYGKLLQVFFSVAHDPTQLNYQGPDQGTQYRSAIFYTSDEQKTVAEAYIAQLDKAGVYPDPIVTEVTQAAAFFAAEGYHQDYATLHPDSGYIAYWDLPKIRNLQATFPELWRDQPVLVMAGKAS